MSQALEGGHYCEKHQGNRSHYAEHNCIVCKLQAALAPQAEKVRKLEEQEPVAIKGRSGRFTNRDSTLYLKEELEALGGVVLFTRPPITSERELELLAVIKQLREALQAMVSEARARNCGLKIADAALASTPDLSAIKEHDAKVLEEVANWGIANKLGILTCDDLRHIAEELRKPS